jgi:ferredoxin-nitrite reductase
LAWLTTPHSCPGLFYGTPAQDGFLIRIRTPSGVINSQQGQAIASLAEEWGGAIQITNRANLQIRSVQTAPTPEVYQTLQTLGLAAQNPSLDHLRNLMASPTAGIDPAELLDIRLLVQALDASIQTHTDWAALPAKFSIGIDGGGTVGIGTRSDILWEHRYNEIQLSALHISDATGQTSSKNIYFQLALGAEKQLWDTQVLIRPEDCVSVVEALAKVYLDYGNQNSDQTRSPKPRMKHLLQDWGVERYLQLVNQHLPIPLKPVTTCPIPPPTVRYGHLGIHPQRQTGLSYIGMSLRLGHLTVPQLTGLVELSETFGSQHLRLTPWQTILLPDIPNERLSDVLSVLPSLDLWSTSPQKRAIATDIYQPQIVACAGKPGCSAAATQTQLHGLALADALPLHLSLASPVNIHLSGCPKSCAQPSPADITLLGIVLPTNTKVDKTCGSSEGYHVYLGIKHLPHQIFESEARQHHLCDVLPPELPSLIEHLLTLYQQHRKTPQESFGEFTARCSIPTLKKRIASAMYASSIDPILESDPTP